MRNTSTCRSRNLLSDHNAAAREGSHASHVPSDDEDDYADDEDEDEEATFTMGYSQIFSELRAAALPPIRQIGGRVPLGSRYATASDPGQDLLGLSDAMRQSMLAALSPLHVPAMGNEYEDPDEGFHNDYPESLASRAPVYEEDEDDLPPLADEFDEEASHSSNVNTSRTVAPPTSFSESSSSNDHVGLRPTSGRPGSEPSATLQLPPPPSIMATSPNHAVDSRPRGLLGAGRLLSPYDIMRRNIDPPSPPPESSVSLAEAITGNDTAPSINAQLPRSFRVSRSWLDIVQSEGENIFPRGR